MSLQTEALHSYCKRHGCVADAGGKFCLNCGNPIVSAGTKDDGVGGYSAAEPADVSLPPSGETKLTNPKDAIGATKLPMSLVPTAVNRYAALAFTEGALKYGRYNWRVAGVRISIYLDAMHRHLVKLQEGEWADEATQVPHLGSVIACAGIILDAWECDKLTDDRPPPNDAAGKDMDSRPAHIAYLKTLFEAYSPHQHVITDGRTEDGI